ncbi:YsnF/AvaK domain-containing protein [Dyadobacter sp. CY347]|uniref:YsnF/AvaK domain-containing protein n=1 Tax=Dyadobacter sp. CY347 TaxID=2909336 RepID=UPI001F25A9F1|nr:YsnF/AvaK domain-containing protein [Dyadobacter sp. CY347]MCF2488590.1 YsnF/AvaK domain-containing protein [Dyadobacter sp. CY347]
MANTVVGIFEYESDAQEAQNYLLANGFAGGDVDIKTASYKSDQETSTINDDNDDVMDRIGNFFKDLFDGDEDETKRYTEAGRRGTIVTVHAADADEAEKAAAILDQYGAVDVNDLAAKNEVDPDYVANAGFGSTQAYTGDEKYAGSERYSEDVTEVPVNPYTDTTVDPYPNRSLDVVTNDTSITNDSSLTDDSFVGDNRFVGDDEFVGDNQSESLPVIKEELQVGKREIETGGVRLRSRIIERPVQESIRLRQEQVNVNRTPVDRVATDSDFNTFTEGTIEMKEFTEIPVVSKEARVVEEVSLNKTVEERDELINETLRHTEVETEDLTDEERLRRSGLDL